LVQVAGTTEERLGIQDEAQVKFSKRSFAALFFLIFCLAASVGVSASGAQSANPPCTIGGPAEKVEGLMPGKPSRPPIVIGCGRSLVGPFEIVAYPDAEHNWLCTFFIGSAFGDGDCGGVIHESLLNRNGFVVTGTGWAWGSGPGRPYTALRGEARPDVARIEVRYHRGNEKAISRVNATLAQVSGELLSALEQTTPFGRFAVVLPGCTVPQGLRVLAFDSEGRMIGSQRGRKSRFGQPCGAKRA
jgi:hypothetical protein